LGEKRKRKITLSYFSALQQFADIRDSSSFLGLLASEFLEAASPQDEDVVVALVSLSSSLRPFRS
jgi:hypothetical protein